VVLAVNSTWQTRNGEACVFANTNFTAHVPFALAVPATVFVPA